MDERHLELKVGLLLLAAVGGVIGLLWLMGELRLAPTASLRVEFSHTGNITKGTPVKMGGVTVGRVENIVLAPQHRDPDGRALPVAMALSVRGDALSAVRTDAQVTVATQGPLGEPYLELYPGSASAPPLTEGTVLRGTDAPRLDVVANQLSAFLAAASRVLEEDPRALTKLVNGAAELSTTINQVLTDNQNELRSMVSEFSAAARDLHAVIALAREQLAPGGDARDFLAAAKTTMSSLKNDLPAATQDARKMLSSASTLLGPLDANDGKKLKEAISRYELASQRLETVLTRAERGEGTLGKLSKDPQLYDDLKDLVAELKQHPWKMLWKN